MLHGHQQMGMTTTEFRGDPGFFDIFKKVGGGILRTAGAVATGSLGTILGGVLGSRGAAPRGVSLAPPPIIQRVGGLAPPRGLPGFPSAPLRPVPGAVGAVQRFLPGGATGFEPALGAACPVGFRPNKSSYTLSSGELVLPGTRCVRVRRRNFANGKALNRSIGRVRGFERMVKRNRKALRGLSRI